MSIERRSARRTASSSTRRRITKSVIRACFRSGGLRDIRQFWRKGSPHYLLVHAGRNERSSTRSIRRRARSALVRKCGLSPAASRAVTGPVVREKDRITRRKARCGKTNAVKCMGEMYDVCLAEGIESYGTARRAATASPRFSLLGCSCEGHRAHLITLLYWLWVSIKR